MAGISARRDIGELRTEAFDEFFREISIARVVRYLHPGQISPFCWNTTEGICSGVAREEISVTVEQAAKDRTGVIEWLRFGVLFHTRISKHAQE